MFIGHFAPAFAAGAATQESPKLGTLFIAAQLVDWAFFLFALFGIESLRLSPGITAMNPLDFHDYPLTHSLVGAAVFAVCFAILIAFLTRNAVAAVWAAVVVMSHWVLDWISHRPDLTIAGGEPKLGLGLWNYPLAAMALELGIFALAVWWYMRRTKGPVGPIAILVTVMLAFQAINWFGPEPVDVGAPFLLLGLFAFTVLTAIAFWVGKTRWHRNEIGLGVASPPL